MEKKLLITIVIFSYSCYKYQELCSKLYYSLTKILNQFTRENAAARKTEVRHNEDHERDVVLNSILIDVNNSHVIFCLNKRFSEINNSIKLEIT